MPKLTLALVVVAALGLTLFLVLGLIGGDGGSEGGSRALDEASVRAAADDDVHLKGTGAPADLVRARSADLRITGRVHDGDGKPLAACRVGVRRQERAFRDPRDPTTWSIRTNRSWDRTGGEGFEWIDHPLALCFVAERETTTGEDGHFEIAVDLHGRYDVRALVEAPRVGSTATTYVSNQGKRRQVLLTVLEGAPLEGRVIDGAGAGVAAVVRGTVDAEGKGTWIADPVETDASDGAFGWPALPPGEGTFTVAIPGRLLLRGTVETAYPVVPK